MGDSSRCRVSDGGVKKYDDGEQKLTNLKLI